MATNLKLTELNPHWVLGHRWDSPNGTQNFIYPNSTAGRRGMGMSFDCPVHRSHKIAIFFSNPLDGLPPVFGEKLWRREGEDFDVISVSPSIDVASCWEGCWHGHIQNGQIV